MIYLFTMVGETNRLPFDLPEGEGELVAGYHTEYSSMKFAMFYLAEYINMTTVSALATTLFLGGWLAPWPISLWSGANSNWWPVLWFLIKVFICCSLHLAARHAAAGPLRPAHGDRLEGPHPAVDRVDPAHRRHPGLAAELNSTAIYVVAGIVLVLSLRWSMAWDRPRSSGPLRNAAGAPRTHAGPAPGTLAGPARAPVPGAAARPAALPRHRSAGTASTTTATSTREVTGA